MFFLWRAREAKQAAAGRPWLRLRCRPRLEILEDRCVFSATANLQTGQAIPAPVVSLASQVTTQPVLNADGLVTGVNAALTGGGSSPAALNVVQSTVTNLPATSTQSGHLEFVVNNVVPNGALVSYGVSSSAPATEATSSSNGNDLLWVASTAGGAGQMLGATGAAAGAPQVTTAPPYLVDLGQVVFDGGTTSADGGSQQSGGPLSGLRPPAVTVTESVPSAAPGANLGSAMPAFVGAPPPMHQFPITIPSGRAAAVPGGFAAQESPAPPTVQYEAWAGQAAVAGYDIIVHAVTIFVVPSPGLVYSVTATSTFIVPGAPFILSGPGASTSPGDEGNNAPSPGAPQDTGALVPVRQPVTSAQAPPVLAFALTMSSSRGEPAALSLSGLQPPPVTVTEQTPWISLREHGGLRTAGNGFLDPLTESAPATAAGPPPFSGEESFAVAEPAPVEVFTNQDAETYLHPLCQVAERGDLSVVTDLSGTSLPPAALETSLLAPPGRRTQQAAPAPPSGRPLPAILSRKQAAGPLRRLGRTLVPIAATWAVLQAFQAGILSTPRKERSSSATGQKL